MSPSPELLLRDTAWLRALTRRLAGDADLAADLQQDVALAALGQPPQANLGRSWLAAVARNLAAMLHRRSARERARLHRLPGCEPVPSPDALVAEADLQQRAVAAVLALPAPYRDTVLLRFLQGLSLQATAAAMRVPQETVRTRQKRALAMLRAALRPAGDERRSVAPLLMSVVSMGVAVKTKQVAVTAAVLLFAVLATVPFWPAEIPAARQPQARSPALAQAGATPGAEEAMPVTADARIEVVEGLPRVGLDGIVSVEAVWSDGEPAADVMIYLSSDLAYAARLQDLAARTDSLGRARFLGVRCGPVKVRSDRAGLVSAVARQGEEARIRLQIHAGLDVRGRVEDAEGRPVAGASIWLTRDPTGSWMSGRFVAQADAAGAFRLRDVPADQSIGAVATGYCPSGFADLESMDTSGPRVWIVLRMTAPGGRFTGRVVDPSGHPVEGAIVAVGEVDPPVHSLTEDARSPRASRTDAQGLCAMEGMAPGEFPIEAWAPGHPRWRGRAEIEVCKSTELTMTLPEGVTVEGTVRTRGGEPVKDVLVVALPIATPENGSLGHANRTPFSHPSAISGADGAYAIQDVPPGAVHLLARSEGRGGGGGVRPWSVSSLTAHPGEAVRWDPVIDKGLSIEGVVRHRSGRPVEGAALCVTQKSNRRAHHAFSDASGCFAFLCLENAQYDLTVVVDGEFDQAVVEQDLMSGDRKIEVVVEDRPAHTSIKGSVSGTVVDRGARLREGAKHWAVLCSRAGLARVELVDGSFVFQGVEQGEYRVSIRSGTDCVNQSAPFALGAAEELVLPTLVTCSAATLVVELDRRPGTVSKEVTLSMTERSTGVRYTRDQVVGAREVFDNLVPGSYRIELEGRSGATQTNCASCWQDVAIEAAGRETCAFVVQPASLLHMTLEFPRGHVLESIDCTGAIGWHCTVEVREQGPTSNRYSCWLSVPAGRLSIDARTNKGARAHKEILTTEGEHCDPVTMLLQ